MGEKATKDPRESNGVNIEEVRPGRNGNGTESKSTSDSRAGGSTGGSTGDRTGGSTGGKTEEKEFSRLAILTEEEKVLYAAGDDTEKKRIMRNAKKRERYRQQKQAGGQTVKPRKVRGKKEPENVLDVTQLNLIIAGVSSAIASRPNCEHWLLTEAEINSITTPLAKMMAESTMFTNMGQYSNQIALVMACITVFAPRLMITAQKQKEVKKRARTGQNTDTNVRDTLEKKKSHTESDRGNDKKSSSNGSDNGNTVPFYGVPIC